VAAIREANGASGSNEKAKIYVEKGDAEMERKSLQIEERDFRSCK
jgi:hypothetical protein